MQMRYGTEDYIAAVEDIRDNGQYFTDCSSFLITLLQNEEESLVLIDRLYELHISYENAWTDYKSRHGDLPAYMLNAWYLAYLSDIEADINEANRDIVASNRVSDLESWKYNTCVENQQKLYDDAIVEFNMLVEKGDLDGWLKILQDIKLQLIPNTAYYKYVQDNIELINKTKQSIENEKITSEEEAQKAIEEAARVQAIEDAQKMLESTESNAVENITDGNYLANAGVVVSQDTEVGYRLDDNVLRQEVVGMAMRIWNFNLPENYTCKETFQDVSASQPNTWACRAVEVAADNGIVTTSNKTFRPEAYITRAEALAILLKAASIQIETSWSTSFLDVSEPWQVNVVNTALSYSFIDSGENFRPNQNATRGEIFNIARRILSSQK